MILIARRCREQQNRMNCCNKGMVVGRGDGDQGGSEGGERIEKREREKARHTWQAERNTLTPHHTRPRDTGTSQLVCVRAR